MGSVRLTAPLVPRGPAAAVVLDDAQVAAVGEGAKRFPVRATVNGYTWRTSVSRMGGEFLLGLNRAVREEAGVQAGDTVDVTLELDTAPREVEVPAALADALRADPEATPHFRRWPSRTARSSPAGSRRPRPRPRVSAGWSRRSRCCAKAGRAPSHASSDSGH